MQHAHRWQMQHANEYGVLVRLRKRHNRMYMR